ncbi:MAG: helix-turn-helix transcriptional regulator [Spirochaetia bacterium]|nr:helix-turn-helix transcriptional regulator [Spirochaetia bacterium]
MNFQFFFGHHIEANNTCAWHRHAAWELVLTLDSPGWIELGGKRLATSPGDLMVLPPNIDHRAHNERKALHLCLGISGEGSESFSMQILRPGAEIESGFDRLRREISEVRDFQEEIVKAQVNELSYRILRKIQNPETPDPKKNRVEKIKTLLDRRFPEPIRIGGLNDNALVSSDALRHAFRKEFGLSPLRYLIQKRIEEAKRLLAASSDPIREVARQTGFEDEFYFSRVFKKETGLSPRAFRKNGGASR